MNSVLYPALSMYITDQPQFLNAACEFHTDLEPLTLLDALKKIEVEMGRNLNGQRYGPRTIDLDILTFSNTIVNEPDGKLVIPHPRIAERQFVLRPLCDISPSLEIETQNNGIRTVAEQLDILEQKEGDAGLTHVTPFQTGRQIRWGEKTWLMGIINATPDSFSDGGRIQTVDAALRQAELFSMNGFHIVDVSCLALKVAVKQYFLVLYQFFPNFRFSYFPCRNQNTQTIGNFYTNRLVDKALALVLNLLLRTRNCYA